ncbi:MAG: hypothetical protein HQ546_10760 [Planctomycetes bacterium]|nr:hypothetical protein [Planctomycetota bacterium]
MDRAADIWADLIDASPHGCQIHLTGGEVFGRFEHLLAVCAEGQRRGLQGLQAVETNAFWATSVEVIRSRLTALDDLGIGRLTISTDPYHQQYVSIDQPRLLAEIGKEVLGHQRVRIRWEDWLNEGYSTDHMSQDALHQVFIDYAARGRDRFTGRAVDGLDAKTSLKPASAFDGDHCGQRLLRGKHVHISPTGEVWPTTCVGITVGNALDQPISQIWAALNEPALQGPIVGPLIASGPCSLLALSEQRGYSPRAQGYASKCQLCYDVRRHLHQLPELARFLAPASVYTEGQGRASIASA